MQCRSGPWFPTGVTSKQELLILPHHLSSPAVVSGVCVARSFVFCVEVCRSIFVHFLLTVALSFLLRFTSSDYSFGIFKLVMFSFCCQLFEMRGVCYWFVDIRTIVAHTLFTLSFSTSQESPFIYLYIFVIGKEATIVNTDLTTGMLSIYFGLVVLNAPLCETVCQWLSIGRWFSPGTPVSVTNKTDCHDITEILLNVVLNTININHHFQFLKPWTFCLIPSENLLTISC